MARRESGSVLLVGSSETCPDIEYASGFRAVDPVVLLKHGSRQCLVVPPLEQGRALGCGTRSTVFVPQQLKLRGRRAWKLEDWALGVVRAEGVRVVTVPPFFPHGVAVRLARAGIRVRVAREALFPQRAVKREDELRHIRQAQQAAVIAMRAAIARLASAEADARGCLRLRGSILTSEAMQQFIAGVLLEHGCSAVGTIVAGGRHSADPHARGEGPLRANEPIVIDIFPRHMAHGYWGDLSRTVVRGRATPKLRRMYHAVRRAQEAALRSIRAGVSGRSVHRAAVQELERRGFKTFEEDGRMVGFIHGTGHGVGLAIHEAPTLGLRPVRLRAGNVVTVEPGLYYPDAGGVRIEDTVIVTAQGWQPLAPCEKQLDI